MNAGKIFVLLGMLLALSLVRTTWADDPVPISEQDRAEHLLRMKSVAAGIRLIGNPRMPESDVELVEEPVLRYSDNTRLLHESSLWVWSSGGRPSAMLAVEFYPKDPRGPRWLFEIASLSTERIAARNDPDLRWVAKEPGLVLQTLELGEPPG